MDTEPKDRPSHNASRLSGRRRLTAATVTVGVLGVGGAVAVGAMAAQAHDGAGKTASTTGSTTPAAAATTPAAAATTPAASATTPATTAPATTATTPVSTPSTTTASPAATSSGS